MPSGTDRTSATTSMGMNRRSLFGTVVGLAAVAAGAGSAAAHTESDFVAVPAGSETTLTLRPTHGCGDSPTVEVRIRVPLEDAVAEPVDGWTEQAEPDDEGNTIVSWTGGELASDEHGEFPITFTAPDTVGELLVFPAIQHCANDEELAWIDGDPESEYPAPRILVLAADAEPAATLDDVADDAPGRDQLTAILDVDNPASSAPDSSPDSTTASTASTASTA